MRSFVSVRMGSRALLALALALVGHAHATAAPSGGRAPRWSQIKTATAPPRRSAAMMAYDGVTQKVLLFGGSGTAAYLADTWLFDGSAWSQVPTSVAPTPRSAAGMAYDRATGQVVLFGGYDGSTHLADTWVWDGGNGTWSAVPTVNTPPGVSLPMMFTDPTTGHVIMIGGFGGMFYYNDTWQWTGNDWLRLSPANVPEARGAAIAALDPVRKSAVIFSGLSGLFAYDTWTWDGLDWTLQSPAQQPSARFYSAAGYDPITADVILFGGNDGSGDLADTWGWDGVNWTPINAGKGPSARESHAMAYDEAIGKLVLFGGVGSALLPFNDTWVFGGR